MDHARFVEQVATLRLETERLVLRRFAPDDSEEAIAQERDPRLMRYVRDIQPLDAVRKKVAGFSAPWRGDDHEWLAIAIARRDDPAMIGSLALRIVSASDDVVEFGYRIGFAAHRQGIASEASRALLAWLFGPIRVRRVIAHCAADNEPSWRLLDKLGFVREAVLREHALFAGVPCDELVYGMLAREWRG